MTQPSVGVRLTDEERELLGGRRGEGVALAARVLVAAADLLGAERLVPIESAHIDGCLHHGDGGVEFAERLAGSARVSVPTTLNVGALDLLHPGRVRSDTHRREMARRQMDAYVAMGCEPTWTCAPYQAGHRPEAGSHVAWGESNAIAFVNSVLGARSERYGDFLDACCAVTGRAPLHGLHLDENRLARIVVDLRGVSEKLKRRDVFYPVLGTWLGLTVGSDVSLLRGLPPDTDEDRLKALGAAAASTGAVALFHVEGVTPEARAGDVAAPDATTLALDAAGLRGALERLSTAGPATGSGPGVDAVAVGSPHFSPAECRRLHALLGGGRTKLPFYVCTSRAALDSIEPTGIADDLRRAGVTFVVDTCVVVAPILPAAGGVLMTCSGKFAHYGPANTGYDVVYGSLEDCVATATSGRLTRDEAVWS